MIVKTNKAGKELESWPTIEDAAKAIKLAPAVLKKHLKGKPPKLNGFIFKEKESFSDEKTENSIILDEAGTWGIYENSAGDLNESKALLEFAKPGHSDPEKHVLRNAGNQEELLATKINYQPVSPEAFDGARLSELIRDEASQMPNYFETVSNNPIMLDEFGEPIGNPAIPPELEDLLDPDEVEDVALKDFKESVSQTHPYNASQEEIANLLRTPLQRRLHEMQKKDAKND